ncbi:Uncharacterized protein dnm_011910 [Desulfonema magnum]|uniref:Uncharacterized protein n=1 Tax=Desulfonema magnum TaxID=45655 RepID=A0A975BGW3_9BACT|nr:Uncharacterized protein dnm_011910 [Desulfonema magnum]
MSGRETRLFHSRTTGHFGKKAGFLSRTNIGNLWLGTYKPRIASVFPGMTFGENSMF